MLGPHLDARTEYRVRHQGVGGIRTFVIDRAFKDEDGRVWAVEYKTSCHEGADIDEFLGQERERYADQLSAYGPRSRANTLGCTSC